MPSATATASNAGPMFADEAGTRTTQPVSTRSSLARSCRALPRSAKYLHNMQRQCAWFGCNTVRSATYTFDSSTCTVWLDTPFEGGARAGDLCDRHARSLTPPRGWRLEDRRASEREDHGNTTPVPASASDPDA